MVFRRRAAPSGSMKKAVLFICGESVAWSCASSALSRGAALKKKVSVSGDWVVAVNEGMTDCQRAMGSCMSLDSRAHTSLRGKKNNGAVTSR